MSAAGGVLGLLLGGVITTYLSWRWILFVNVPVGVVLALAAPRVLTAARRRPGRLDLPGAVSVTAGATVLVYALTRAADHGWGDSWTVGSLVVAAVLLAAFVVIEATSRQPLMQLRILADRGRSSAYVLSLAIGAALSGMLFLLTLFLQDEARRARSAGWSGRPQSRRPRQWERSTPTTRRTCSDHCSRSPWVSASVVAISGISPTESGLASALLNVGRQLGGSLGIAVMGTIAATVTRNQLAAGALTHSALDRALTDGFGAAFGVAGLIALAAFVMSVVVVRGMRGGAIEAEAA